MSFKPSTVKTCTTA